MPFFIPSFFHRISSTPVLSFLTLSMPAVKFWFQEHLSVFTPNLSKYGRSLPLKYSQVVFYSIILDRYKKVLCDTLKRRFLKEKKGVACLRKSIIPFEEQNSILMVSNKKAPWLSRCMVVITAESFKLQKKMFKKLLLLIVITQRIPSP